MALVLGTDAMTVNPVYTEQRGHQHSAFGSSKVTSRLTFWPVQNMGQCSHGASRAFGSQVLR